MPPSDLLFKTKQQRIGSVKFSIIALIAVGLAITAGGVYWWKRTHRHEVPAVATANLEQRVIDEIEKARSAVVDEPESALAWGRVGLVLFANDLYAESRPWLERAGQLDPRDPRWPYFLGMVTYLDRPEAAVGHFEQAVQLAPKDADMRLRLAEALMVLDRADEADAAFAEVLRLSPDHPRALLGRGQILMRRNKSNEAAPLLEKAANDPTAQKSARAALAEAYQRLNNEKAADEHRAHAAAAEPDVAWPDSHLQRISIHQVSLKGRIRQAGRLMAENQFDDAVTLLRLAVKEQPASGEAHLNLGRALIRSNRFDEAEEPLEKAVKLDGTLTDGFVLLGGISFQRKEFQQAEKYYRQALEVKADHATAHFLAGQCRLAVNDKPGAVAAFRDAVRYRPAMAEAQLALGELLLERGETADAIASLEIAAKHAAFRAKAGELLAKAREKKKP